MKKQDKYLLAAGGVVALLLLWPRRGGATAPVSTGGGSVANLSYLGQSGLPKGMRNNNPGNIRVSSNPWQGKVPLSQNTDGAFEQFTTYVYGIRAMIKNLLTYYTRDGLRTLKDIIFRWAPPADNNDTSAYVTFVSNKTGLSPTQQLNLNDAGTMRKLVIAMTEMENGRPAVTPEQFNYAWTLV